MALAICLYDSEFEKKFPQKTLRINFFLTN